MSKLQFCCVWNCDINSINNPNVLFFNLPKNEERFKHWIDFCCRDDLMLRAYCNEVKGFNNLVGKICELHFTKTMSKTELKNKLLKNALPTLFNVNIPIHKNIVVMSNTQASTSDYLTPPEENHNNNNKQENQKLNPIDEKEMNIENETTIDSENIFLNTKCIHLDNKLTHNTNSRPENRMKEINDIPNDSKSDNQIINDDKCLSINERNLIDNNIQINNISFDHCNHMIGLTIGNHHNTTSVEEINKVSTINDSNKSTASLNATVNKTLSNKKRRHSSSRSSSSFDEFKININFIQTANKHNINNMEKNKDFINLSNGSDSHSSDNEIVNDNKSCRNVENNSGFFISQEDHENEINTQVIENTYQIPDVKKTNSILLLNYCSTNTSSPDAEPFINPLQLAGNSSTNEQSKNENISNIELPSIRYKTIYSSNVSFPNRSCNTNDVSYDAEEHQFAIDEEQNKSIVNCNSSSTHESKKIDSIQTNVTKRNVNTDLQNSSDLLSSNEDVIDQNHLQNDDQGLVDSHSIDNIVQNYANRIDENNKLIDKTTIQTNNSIKNITNKQNSNDLNTNDLNIPESQLFNNDAGISVYNAGYDEQETVYSIDMDIEQSSNIHLTNNEYHNYQQFNTDNKTDVFKIECPQHITNCEPFRYLTNVQPFADIITIVHRSESSTLKNKSMNSFTQTICADEPSLIVNKNGNGNATIDRNDNSLKDTMDSTVNRYDTSIIEKESMIKQHVLENIESESTFMGTEDSNFIFELINDDSQSLLPFNILSHEINNSRISNEKLCSEISSTQELDHTDVNLMNVNPSCKNMNVSLLNGNNVNNNNICYTNSNDLSELEENQNNFTNEKIKVTAQTDDLENISTLTIRSDLRSSAENINNNELKEEQKEEEEHLYCPICCVQIFYSIEEHIISYHSFAKSYDCEMCKESFSSSDELQMHFKSHANQVNPYTCPLCNKRFRLVDEIKNHIVTHAYEYTIATIANATSKKSASKNMPSTISTPIRLLSNVKLPKKSIALKNLRQVSKSRAEVQSTITQGKIKKSSQISKAFAKNQSTLNVKKKKSQVRSTTKRCYKCFICKNMFFSNAIYLRHLRKSYYNLIPFKCKECKKLHYNFYELINHFDEYPDHNNITFDDYKDKKSFECYDCKKVFKCFYNCQYHIKKYH